MVLGAASQARAVGPMRSVRYPTLDAMRGLALVSMVTAHVSLPGSPTMLDRAFHKALWIDGAFYFVVLSGVVTGLVHRRVCDRQGFEASARKLARRAGFIYLVQVGLVAATITLASVRSSAQVFNTPTWSELGLVDGLWELFRLRLEPNFTGVLSMYVVFLLLAIPAVALLRRGWWWAVVGGGAALYALGRLTGGFTFAPVPTSFDPIGWQLLFLGGMLVGWAFEHERLAIPAPVRRRVVVASAVVSVVFLALAFGAGDRTTEAFGWTITKFNGGFVAFVFAWAFLITVYAVLDGLRHRFAVVDKVMRPIEILGLKGLPGYVAMVLTILVFAAFPSLPRNDLTVVFVVVVSGFAEYGAVRLDAWRRARARARARAAATVSVPDAPAMPAPSPTLAPPAGNLLDPA